MSATLFRECASGAGAGGGAVPAGQAWRELVDASEDDYPLRAARLCLAQAEAQLTTPNSKQYPSIVALLVHGARLLLFDRRVKRDIAAGGEDER